MSEVQKKKRGRKAKVESVEIKEVQAVETKSVASNNKRALLIGINYSNTTYSLRGCLNDIFDIESILKDQYGFTDISLLLEERATKPNIISSIRELLTGCNPGDILYLHYSGHGTQVPNRHESDGLSEAICPYGNVNSVITDRELKELFSTIPIGVNLTVCFDSCHSGNATRDIRTSGIPNTYTIQGYRDRYVHFTSSVRGDITYLERAINNINNDPELGNIAFISGCKDNQTSADAYIQGRYNGAFTYSLVQLLKMNPKITYLKLITSINEVISALQFEQIPQLECHKDYTNIEFLSQLGEK